jgi:hypothetical protein
MKNTNEIKIFSLKKIDEMTKPILLATHLVEFRRIVFQLSVQENIQTIPSQPISGHGGTCLSSHVHGEAQIRGSRSRLAWA